VPAGLRVPFADGFLHRVPKGVQLDTPRLQHLGGNARTFVDQAQEKRQRFRVAGLATGLRQYSPVRNAGAAVDVETDHVTARSGDIYQFLTLEGERGSRADLCGCRVDSRGRSPTGLGWQ
jgi:hypothetical protein